MQNNNFNNRYSIEYLHPANDRSSGPVLKKKSKIIPFFFFSLIGFASFYVWDNGYLKPILDRYMSEKNITSTDETKAKLPMMPISGFEEIEEPIATKPEVTIEPTITIKPVIVEEKTVEAPPVKIIAITQQVKKSKENELLEESNKILIDKLNKLSDQLSIQKKKNNELTERLNKNKKLSTNISSLYGDAIKSANSDDQDYLKVLEGEISKKDAKSSIQKSEKIKKETTVSSDTANTVTATEVASSESLNNTVILSTKNQMDKILLAMQSTKKQTINKSENQEGKVNINTQSIAKMTMDLQQQINKLTSSEMTVPKTTFTKALETESVVRKNAVRSVVIRKGETLWSIAKRAYGNGFDYPKILKANPGLKKGKIVRLRIGQVIRVPI